VQDDLRLITPPGHRLAGRRAFRWADVAGEPFVGFEAGTAVRDVIDSASTAAGVTLSVVMELRSIESIKQMVAAGIGVGLVSRFALPTGQGLVCKDGPLSRSLALARSASRMPSPAAAAFQAILARSLATFA
jgi:DNA-binding transcriptional LysR family regulator